MFLVQRSQGRFGVKVVDFGIAKTPINTRLTKMGEALGSPRFMSPEACRGEDVDQRADLYSFGVLLYLMLCGRVPFDDDNLLRVLQMQVSEPLPPPRSINPEVSPELAAGDRARAGQGTGGSLPLDGRAADRSRGRGPAGLGSPADRGPDRRRELVPRHLVHRTAAGAAAR